MIEEHIHKYEIKIDPLDFHEGLKDKMAEFESLIRMPTPDNQQKEEAKKKNELLQVR